MIINLLVKTLIKINSFFQATSLEILCDVILNFGFSYKHIELSAVQLS